MEFKVLTCKEQIRGPLGKYSNNCDISPNQPFFINGEKTDKTLVRGEDDYELNPENRVLVQGQMMRYSESKGQKVGIV